jgi:hypothetical protein
MAGSVARDNKRYTFVATQVVPLTESLPLFRKHLAMLLAAVAIAAAVSAAWLVGLDAVERTEFRELVSEARAEQPITSEDADVLRIMSRVNGRLKGITVQPEPFQAEVSGIPVSSSHDQLHNPAGACASYSHVLAKSLMTAGYQVRKVGLSKGSQMAIHHVVEVKVGNHWVLLDALYNLAFRAPDGHLASAAEVSRDWPWFKRQVPGDYSPDYDYSGFYYTNWDRIPLIGSIVRASPPLGIWLRDQGVSVRFWFFNTYRWGAGLAAIISITAWWLRRHLLHSSPVTV